MLYIDADAEDAARDARDAIARRDRERIAELLTVNPLEVWFRLHPDEFRMMLELATREILRSKGAGAIILRALAPHTIDSRAAFDAHIAHEAEHNVTMRQTSLFMQAGLARLHGDSVEALAMMRDLEMVREPVHRLFDVSRGVRPFVVLQTGITAILAGEFTEALTLFQRFLVFPVPERLAFLIRDAHLRSALLHALFGSREVAREHAASAASVPRTDSWVEGVLDADEALLQTLLLADDDPTAAFSAAVAMPVSRMHELWPLYIVAIHRLGVQADRPREARDRLRELQAVGLVGQPRRGLAGSIFPLVLAFDALLGGGVSLAEDLVADADPDHWQTQLVCAVIAIMRGNTSRARSLANVAASATAGLRVAENLRLAVLALVHHAERNDDAALMELSEVARHPDPFTLAVVPLFEPDLARRAGLLAHDGTADRDVSGTVGVLERETLTRREHDILRGLAEGLSREEIARANFIALNTVKTHQRTLHRKLGVRTRDDAVREGRRRGLV